MGDIDYLRLSITNNCNLNCIYCRPLHAPFNFQATQLLSPQEMLEIVKMLVANGIRKLRITGGEPLIREDVVELVEIFSNIKGLEEIAMTTNGVLLKEIAKSLKKAGLCRINISLDTLKKDRYKNITGKDFLDRVLESIEASLSAGFFSVKLNVVVMKDINDDEILDFVEWALPRKIIVRFIEHFSTNIHNYSSHYFIPNAYIKEKIESSFGALERISGVTGSGPAQYFKIRHDSAIIGFIDTVTSNFCHKCSRLRMSCDGKLYQCLFSPVYLDMKKTMLLQGASGSKQSLQEFISEKRYYTKNTIKSEPFEMSRRGG